MLAAVLWLFYSGWRVILKIKLSHQNYKYQHNKLFKQQPNLFNEQIIQKQTKVGPKFTEHTIFKQDSI